MQARDLEEYRYRMRSRLLFKNGRLLYLEALSHQPLSGLDSYRSRGIRAFYWLEEARRGLFGRKKSSESARLARSLKERLLSEGFEWKMVDLSRLAGGDFDYLRKVFADLQRSLRQGRCLCCYGDGQEQQAALFACCFLISLKSTRSAPLGNIIQYMLGRPAQKRQEDMLHAFRQFCNAEAPGSSVSAISSKISSKADSRLAGRSGSEKISQELQKKSFLRRGGKKTGSEGEANSMIDRDRNIEERQAIEAAGRTAQAGAPIEGGPKPNRGTAPAAVGAVAGGEGSSVNGAPLFRLSRLTIRLKLISAISTLIFISLGAMVYLASDFFEQETEIRIQENNINLVQVVGQRVESELQNIASVAQLTALTLLQNTAFYPATFFRNNPDAVFVGVARREGNRFNFVHSLYNSGFMLINGITEADIRSIHEESQSYFGRAAGANFTLHNASKGDLPLLAISQSAAAGYIAVLYLHPDRFFETFAREGIVTIFMVNSDGDVLAHPDSELFLSRTSFVNSPIVEAMLESPVLTGQTRYVEGGEEEVFLGSFQRLETGGLGIIAYVAEDVVFAPVRKLQERNIYIMIIILAFAVIFLYFFAKTITVPISALVGATKEVEAGRFQIEIKPAFRDEVGSLTHSFRSMTVGLGERERIKDAFGKFVNKELAETALRGEIKLGGESRYAAIFFSDLRNFTAMSERMTPDEVVSYLNEYFTGMVKCINDTYGIVDKYIGDAIMAHWGAVRTKGNETENAINAALKMRQALIEFNQRGGGRRPIANMGSGINTGEVISGQIGSQDRLEYTVIGDAVNLASRIEALNKPFRTDILISEEAFDRVEGIFRLARMPSIKVKGKAKPQRIYAVIGRGDDPNCPKDLDEVRQMLGIKGDVDLGQASSEEQKFRVLEGEQ